MRNLPYGFDLNFSGLLRKAELLLQDSNFVFSEVSKCEFFSLNTKVVNSRKSHFRNIYVLLLTKKFNDGFDVEKYLKQFKILNYNFYEKIFSIRKFFRIFQISIQAWYFVTKIVLTYFKKNLF